MEMLQSTISLIAGQLCHGCEAKRDNLISLVNRYKKTYGNDSYIIQIEKSL